MSIERSITTVRGFMSRSMSRVTSSGARSPCTATAPSTRSAKERAFSMLGRVASIVVTGATQRRRTASRRRSTLTVEQRHVGAHAEGGAGGRAARARRRRGSRSCAGGTPGAPPSRMPLPPNSFSSRPAPMVTREAAGDLGHAVSTGARPGLVLDGLQADGRDLALQQRPQVLGTRGGQAPRTRSTTWPGCSSSYSARLGREDAHEQLGAREGLRPAEGDGGPGRLVVGVGMPGRRARPRSRPRRGGRAGRAP